MSEFKAEADKLEAQAKSAALSAVNSERTWLAAHRTILIAIGVSLAVGAVIGHLL